jgi:hypothetical protein
LWGHCQTLSFAWQGKRCPTTTRGAGRAGGPCLVGMLPTTRPCQQQPVAWQCIADDLRGTWQSLVKRPALIRRALPPKPTGRR